MSLIFLGMTVIHRRNEKQMLCKFGAWVFVCFDGPCVEVNNSGGSWGGARGARPPPPLVLDQTDWIRHWINSLLRDNCTKLATGEIGSQSENSIYFSLRTCESRHIILSLWRLGGELMHFFTDFYNFSFCYLFFTSPVYHYTRFWLFTLGTWRKIGSVLSRFSFTPHYLTKLN